MSFQINAYSANPPADIAQRLHVLVIGGNDLRGIAKSASATDYAARLDVTIAALELALNTLTELGARYILLANVPDLGRLPESILREQSQPGYREGKPACRDRWRYPEKISPCQALA